MVPHQFLRFYKWHLFSLLCASLLHIPIAVRNTLRIWLALSFTRDEHENYTVSVFFINQLNARRGSFFVTKQLNISIP